MTEPDQATRSAAEDYAEYVAPLTTQFFPAFFKLASVQPGERVLDLACGPGDTTLEAAARSGPQGEVLGIDTSAEMIALARRRALDAGMTNVRFEVMEPHTLALDDLYWDVTICHLGIGEFVDPIAVLREVHRVLRPVGRTCFSSWGQPARSPWLAIPFDAAHEVIPARPASAQAPAFRFGEPGVLSRALAEGGFEDVTPDRLSSSVEYAEPDAYWEAVTRGLVARARPLTGLSDEQLAAVREAGTPALRRWRHPRTNVLRPPAEIFIGVACK